MSGFNEISPLNPNDPTVQTAQALGKIFENLTKDLDPETKKILAAVVVGGGLVAGGALLAKKIMG
ncbi:hypothetical protein [Azospirillum brasilense]|uniref:hypothetical protein n=1 Tax=Azospirillum brasilense TaxID=192 RepID=UPI001EDACB63|nr:hypothetical protein [Azospirillum brasilense]UKJ76531.1 hypothetical protein H1Q64_26440 [Azospirillum brasilense]